MIYLTTTLTQALFGTQVEHEFYQAEILISKNGLKNERNLILYENFHKEMQNANYIGFWKQESFFQIMSNTLKAVCIL